MNNLTDRKWFYPVIYVFLVIISMLPPITAIKCEDLAVKATHLRTQP